MNGYGYLSYTIQANPGLPTGTQIRNVALIMFDKGQTIATDQVNDNDPSQGTDPTREALVTIDSGAPTSSVLPLPSTTTSESFPVSWSGQDDPRGSGIAHYDVYVSVDGGPFAIWEQATTDTTDTYTGSYGHTYSFYSVAMDNVGNQQSIPGSAQATIRVVKPAVIELIGAVSPSPRNVPVSTVSVTFNEPVIGGPVDPVDISLTDNGGPNLITTPVFLVPTGTNIYAITGLGSLTNAEGDYTLTLDAAGVQDMYGNPGAGTASVSWLMDTTPPTSTVNPLPATTSSSNFTVSVTGSDPNGSGGAPASGIASYAIYNSEDGGPFALFATVTPSDPSATFTGQTGHSYSFYSVATDIAGNIQPTPTAAQQTVRIAPGLGVTSISAASPDPRNAPVSTIDVTFNEPIDLGAVSPGALMLTDDGGPNLVNGSVTLSLVPGTMSTYAIGGLSGLTQADGHYTLSVDTAGLRDQDGNAGSGTASTSWLIDKTAPTSHVALLPTRATSLDFPVAVTGTDPDGPGSSPASGVASYDIYESTNGGPWSLWTTVPASQPTATYNGQSNTTYSFYSVAHDLAGNVESKAATIEASTYVPDLTPPVTTINGLTGADPTTVNTATGTIALNLDGHDVGGSGLAYFEVFASVDGGAYRQVGWDIPAGVPDSSGNVQATYLYQGETDGQSHTYAFYSIGIDGAGNIQAPPSGPNLGLAEVFGAAASGQLQMTGLTVEHGAAERSYVRYLDLSFNESNTQSSGELASLVDSVVNNPSSPAAQDIALYKYSLSGTGTPTRVALPTTLSVIDHAIEIDFGAGGLGGAPNSTAADGYYELDIKLPDGTTSVHHFYRLLGDVTGDGVVDGTGIGAIRNALNETEATGMGALNVDVNGDGTVSALDLVLATRSKGRKLASGLSLG